VCFVIKLIKIGDFADDGINAWGHLSALLVALEEQQGLSSAGPVTLAAFSKGCVVLNRLVRELPATKELALVRRVRTMSWLDGGHSGLSAAVYVTDEAPLKALAEHGASVDVRVTPRQVLDPSRPHIGRQEASFHSSLVRHGVAIRRKLYFSAEEPSLQTHFRVLDTLREEPWL